MRTERFISLLTLLLSVLAAFLFIDGRFILYEPWATYTVCTAYTLLVSLIFLLIIYQMYLRRNKR